MFMLSYYDPSSCALFICLSDKHVTSKIIYLLSLTYSGRAGVKLGDVDMLQMYLYFLMLRACFVYDPTCFMCIFIQYLAFLGTNLLTRCHSASSCFLLFLYFRKDVQEIFLELHGTNCQCLIIT